jgi:hypothetical protein
MVLLLLLLLCSLPLTLLQQLLKSCSCTLPSSLIRLQQPSLLLALPQQAPVRLRLTLYSCPLLCQRLLRL